MLPRTLALVDDDREFGDFLADYFRRHGVQVRAFRDANALLGSEHPFDYEFYVLDLMLPGMDGVRLIQTLRQRSNAGIVVVSGRADPGVFREVVQASADMYLSKPVQFEQVALAVKAVQRRAASAQPAAATEWRLDRHAGQLVAPDQARIPLSPADMTVMECFGQAAGAVVERETLRQRLGRETPTGPGADGLNAVIFRLRRRIERATPLPAPLQSRSGVGYVVRAPLTVV